MIPANILIYVPIFSYVDALHFCVDGNFHFNLKPKHSDPKDVPLTIGAAYFGHEEDFKYYIATTKPYPNEVSGYNEKREHRNRH